MWESDVSGLVYATHPTNALLAYVLLSGGYGHSGSGTYRLTNTITQGEKLYMTDAAGTGSAHLHQRWPAGNTFAGYALPANEADAAATVLVATGATGNVMVLVPA